MRRPHLPRIPNPLFEYPYSPKAEFIRQEVSSRLFPKDFVLAIQNGETVSSHQYIHQVPIKARGYDLFLQQMKYANGTTSKKIWNLLRPEYQLLFSDHPRIDELFQHQVRIWQGYEIVEHLKRTQDYDQMTNPYTVLGLYPWEIIKDKLRHQRKLEVFEADYYDMVIESALYSAGKLPTTGERKYRLQNPSRRFELLSDVEKQKYKSRAEREVKFRQNDKKQTLQVPSSGFNLFVQNEFSTVFEGHPGQTIAQLAHKWDKMSSSERDVYNKEYGTYFRTKEYREQLLDWKTNLVMKYVYQVVQNSSFDYEKDKREKVGGLVYLDKIYSPWLVLSSKGRVKVMRGKRDKM